MKDPAYTGIGYSNKAWNCPPEWDVRSPCDSCNRTDVECGVAYQDIDTVEEYCPLPEEERPW